jgi:hypothetical protein
MGAMGVKKNPYIEAWVARRETLEETFRFTPRNVWNALLFGVGVPLGLYVLFARDMQESKNTETVLWKHQNRDFLGFPAKPDPKASH